MLFSSKFTYTTNNYYRMSEGSGFEKKNVIVFGGAGFIGSNLCERLLKDAKVICIDDLSGGTSKNIEHLMQFEDFEFLKHDCTEPIDLTAYPELEKFKVKFQGIQEVYNFACPTTAKEFEKFKLQTLRANSLGVINTLEVARAYNAKYVFGSSSVVYGPRVAGSEVCDEATAGVVDQLSARACYDEGKRFAETCVSSYAQMYGIDAKIARIFRTYGPREKLFDAQLIPDFITAALGNEDIVLYGDERFSSSLVYVTDVVDGVMRLMKAPAGIGPVNFGGEDDVKMVDVANMIISMTHSTSVLRYEAPLQFTSQLNLPSIQKAKEQLGWLPLVRLEDGLLKTIDYIIAHKQMMGL